MLNKDRKTTLTTPPRLEKKELTTKEDNPILKQIHSRRSDCVGLWIEKMKLNLFVSCTGVGGGALALVLDI